MFKCGMCGSLTPKVNAAPYGTKTICPECLQKLEEKPIVCPNCGTEISERDYVGVYLRRIATMPVPEFDSEMLTTVCPNCKILFMDEFQWEIVQGLKNLPGE